MRILAIDTSCDETAVAVVEGRKVLSNVIFSQILIHKKWGGVVPNLAKKAHEDRIDMIVQESLRRYLINRKITDNLRYGFPNNIEEDAMKEIGGIAVTQGPGLAVALEVGIKKAKEMAKKYRKKLIAVNHLEGHIYSPFVQNRQGKPKISFNFPYLALIVSGGHTELVVLNKHLEYQRIGATLDDAAGEALDKAAKLLGLGYPGGPLIERLAKEADNKDYHNLPRPMLKSDNLNFSFSGLKTAFYYLLKKGNQNLSGKITRELASSFQCSVFEVLVMKTEKAIKKTGINNLLVGGGVIANLRLRKLFRDLASKYSGKVAFPPYKYLTGDNAAMIGVVASFKAEKELYFNDLNVLDREPRLELC